MTLPISEKNFRDRLAFRTNFLSSNPKQRNQENGKVPSGVNIVCDHCGDRCTKAHWHCIQPGCEVVCSADHECFVGDLCYPCFDTFSLIQKFPILTGAGTNEEKLRLAMQFVSERSQPSMQPNMTCSVCECVQTDYNCNQFQRDTDKDICTGCAKVMRFLLFPMMPRSYSPTLKSVVETLDTKGSKNVDQTVSLMDRKDVEKLAQQQFAERMAQDSDEE